MGKGDVYYLIHPDGHTIAKFEQDADYMGGKCYECVTWESKDGGDSYDEPCEWLFVADVSCKWDGCTHWFFNGEDYEGEAKDCSSYYHLCGAFSFLNHIRYMCFIWKLAPMIISEYMDNMEYTYYEYYGRDEIRNLVNTMLKDYTIKKEGS